MPLKYFGDMPIAVTIVGPIHGLLFMMLCFVFLIGRSRIPLPGRLAVAGIAGAIVPFGPFVVDRWLARLASSPSSQ